MRITQVMKSKKKQMFTTIAILMSLGVFFMVSNMMLAKEKILNQFEDALRNGRDISQFITSADPNHHISGDEIEVLRKYLTIESDVFYKQLTLLKKGEGANDELMFTVKKKKDSFLLDEYIIEVKPVYVTFEIEESEFCEGITLNDKKISMNKKTPLLPGDYDFKIHFKSPHISFIENENLLLLPDKGRNQVTIPIKGHKVFVISNFPEATLFMNGEDTGITIGDGLHYAPVAKGAVLNAGIKLPWGVLKSDPQRHVVERYQFRIDPTNDTVKKQLLQATRTFIHSLTKAIKDKDHTLLQQITPEAKAAAVVDINKGLKDINANLVNITFDEETAYVRKDVNEDSHTEFIGFIEVKEVFQIDGSEVPISFYNVYKLKYDFNKQQWLVYSWRNNLIWMKQAG